MIERDLDFEADLIEMEKNFWEYHVQCRVEPPYTESGDLVLESLRRHFGNADMLVPEVELKRKFATEIEAYIQKHNEKLALDKHVRELETEMKQLQAKIVTEMGNGCRATCKSGKERYVITHNPSFRTLVSKDNLSRLKLAHPMLYDEYVTSSESRRFVVKKESVS